MTDTDRHLIGWVLVLALTGGMLYLLPRVREWLRHRAQPDPLQPSQVDGEQYQMTRFSLRRDK